MIVKTFIVGEFATNCYVAGFEQTKEAVVIDPGFCGKSEAEKIFNFIEEHAFNIKSILNTHGHPDHTCGNGIVKEKFRVPILIHEFDAHMLGEMGRKVAEFFGTDCFSPPADSFLHDADLINFGKESLKIILTPGHSRGGISLLGKEEVFTGDTLFFGSIGRIDFPEGSEKDMNESLKKLTKLPDNFVVYPGHGPTTTIGEEKRNNPFLQQL